MCGQVGIIFGHKRRGSAEQDYLCEVFLRLLLHSEAQGPHASGLAWLKTDGTHRIVKQPLPASELVYAEDFQNALCEVDNQTTLLMGHARWRTRGDEFNNRNNPRSAPAASSAPTTGPCTTPTTCFGAYGCPASLRSTAS